MRPLLLLFLLCTTSIVSYSQKEVSLASLLHELTSRQSVAHWPQTAYTEWMASSYDRSAVSPDKPGWFGNHDFSQYIRTEVKAKTGSVPAHEEEVMMDVDGPGAIVRFWVTTTENRDGILRIYLDNAPVPTITINGYDLMLLHYPLAIPHSSYAPKGKGGSTLYLPIAFAKHCKVTWQEKVKGNIPPRYYQINYRKYSKGTAVRSFTPDQLEKLSELIQKTKQVLWHPLVENNDLTVQTGLAAPAEKQIQVEKYIAAGQAVSIQLPHGAAQIEHMEINVGLTTAATDKNNKPSIGRSSGSGNDSSKGSTIHSDSLLPHLLRFTVLNMFFDGQRTVWCPVGDFSGAGVGSNKLESWYRKVAADGTIISRWIMPYQKNATITLKNTSQLPVNITMKLRIRRIHWQPSTMYFHASWRQSLNATIKKWDTAGARELNMITIKGKGVYVGNTLAVFNHMHTWYGEGDQKIWRDRVPFPIEFGTGLEDYYNTSWAPVMLYQTPFANAPRADNPDSYGYNTFTRTRNLDAVPFNSSFKMDVELLGWQTGTADFATTVYWYGFAGAVDNSRDKAEGNRSEAASPGTDSLESLGLHRQRKDSLAADSHAGYLNVDRQAAIPLLKQ